MDRIIRHDRLSDRLGLLWIGLGLYMFPYVQCDLVRLSMLGDLLFRLLPVGTILIFTSLFSSLRPSQIERSRTAWALIYLLLGWHLYMVFRLDPSDLLGISTYYDPYSYTVYLFALVLLIPPIPMLKSYLHIAKWLIPIGIPLTIVPLLYYASFSAIQFCFEGYLGAAGLLVMTSKYHKKTWIYLGYSALILAFLVATIKARRGLMATTLLYILGGIYMTIFKSKKLKKSTILFISASAICFVLVAAAIFMLGSKGVFSEIAGRAGENTRDYVFLLFFWDMIQTPMDIIFGRGIRGGYDCQGVDEGGKTIRFVIENGVLHMMLKGGTIYILLVLTTLCTAIKKAWKSTNQLCQASIIIIAIQLFDLLPFGLHAANVKTFVIWMCVSICLCPSICTKSDEELLNELTEKKQKLPKWG